MTSLEYRVTDARDLDLIRPLWNQLNSHHLGRSRVFQHRFRERTFEDRMAYFGKIAAVGSLRVDLAFDPGAGRYVGYCVSSLSEEKEGEIESIFVEEGVPGAGRRFNPHDPRPHLARPARLGQEPGLCRGGE